MISYANQIRIHLIICAYTASSYLYYSSIHIYIYNIFVYAAETLSHWTLVQRRDVSLSFELRRDDYVAACARQWTPIQPWHNEPIKWLPSFLFRCTRCWIIYLFFFFLFFFYFPQCGTCPYPSVLMHTEYLFANCSWTLKSRNNAAMR